MSTCTVLLHSSLWLAPYCSLVASTLLLLAGWHPLCLEVPLACLSSPMVALLLCYRLSWYCTAAVAAANSLDQLM